MKNYEIFNDYDMVVAITQDTINQQLNHLTRMGTIHPRLRLVQTVDVEKQEYDYVILGDTDPIPPNCAYIDAHILPQINIAESGEIVTFILNFNAGKAAFWTGMGPFARLSNPPLDMKGWTYAITVNMDLAKLEADDLAGGKAIPDNVKAQLEQFNSQMFDVNHLFMDFESTDLMRFDPVQTTADGAGDTGLEQLVIFMQFYLKDLLRTGNPYILGYSLTTNDQTAYDKDLLVPDLIRPVSTTYSMFHDSGTAKLSTLNFILATKGGHGKVSGTPGVFDTNWVVPDANGNVCNAVMAYSHSVLLDAMILQPFYDNFSLQTWTGIKDNVNVPQGNDFATGRANTDTGYKFTISNVSAGDDQYVNTYTVDITNTPPPPPSTNSDGTSGDGTSDAGTTEDSGSVTLTFKGNIHIYKEVGKDLGVAEAKASATGDIAWSGTYTITLDKSADGTPRLKVDHASQIDSHSSDSWQNDAAKAFEWIGKILGGILDALTGFADQGFLSNLFGNLLSIDAPGIGDVSVALGDLGDTTAATILLPAGDVFAFKQPTSDVYANLAMQLTYKSES